MSMLKKAKSGAEFNSKEVADENYDSISSRISNDFVSKDDFLRILSQLLDYVDPNHTSGIDVTSILSTLVKK